MEPDVDPCPASSLTLHTPVTVPTAESRLQRTFGQVFARHEDPSSSGSSSAVAAPSDSPAEGEGTFPSARVIRRAIQPSVSALPLPDSTLDEDYEALDEEYRRNVSAQFFDCMTDADLDEIALNADRFPMLMFRVTRVSVLSRTF